MQERKIVYVRGRRQPYKHPTHARRFPNFAARNNIKFHDYFAPAFSEPDVTILTPAVDLSYWKRHWPGKGRVIFDANDPYLLESSRSFRSRFRGLAKFLTQQHSYLDANYKRLYRDVCLRSDAVVVSHFAQRELLDDWGVNVWEIKDYPASSGVSKSSYKLVNDAEINIFWEGLGSSFLPFGLLEEIFKEQLDRGRYRFHFVTDLSFYRVMDKFWKVNVKAIAKTLAPTLYQQFYFHEWTPENFSKTAEICDYAVIPLPLDDSMNYWKPETKLLQLWRTGMPVLASGIPSYQRAFELAGVAGFSSSTGEWREKIHLYSTNVEARTHNARNGMLLAEKLSPDVIDVKWQQCINSI